MLIPHSTGPLNQWMNYLDRRADQHRNYQITLIDSFSTCLVSVLDATAKIPSGILELKLHWPGDYELCENVFGEYNSAYTNKLEPFTGKYCRIDIGFASNVVSSKHKGTSLFLTLTIRLSTTCKYQ